VTDRPDRDFWTGEPTEPPTTPPPPQLHLRGWAAYMALVSAVLQVPWAFGRLWVAVFEWAGGSENPVMHREFVVGRAILVAPGIAATVLACVALVGRRRGRYRVVAAAALAVTLVWLLLTDLGVHVRAGD
jgi:hypothetical protein